MAKITRKSLKNLKTSKGTKKTVKGEEIVPPAPPIEEGMVSIAFSPTDLATFANLMTVCAKTFEALALQAAEQNDVQSFRTLQARLQLSSAFASKLSDSVRMPEPVSRDMH